MRGRAGGLDLALKVDAQRPGFEGLKLGGIELAALDHLRQHDVAALHGALWVEYGVVVAVALEHADQRGALQHVKRLGRFVKVGARRHLNAKGVVEKRHGVEIGLQNFGLAVEGLDLQRGDGFFELAGERGCPADFLRVQVARQLLREGGAALAVARKSAERGRGGAPPVQAKVLIKAVVFGGNECGQNRRRHLLQRHPGAVGRFEFSQQPAIA